MVRMIERSMLLGLGILTLTRDRVVQTVNSMVAEGQVKEEEASNIIDRLVARGEEEREELRNMVRDELDKLRINMPISKPQDHHDKLHRSLSEDLPKYIEILRNMVEINSFTSNPNGVNRLGEYTSSVFANLEFSSENIMSTNPLHGDHLVLRRLSDGVNSLGTIACVSHLDTVYPADEERRNNFSWRVEGDRIYGPGTVDIKGGTVMIYMILDALSKQARDHARGTGGRHRPLPAALPAGQRLVLWRGL